MEQKTKINAEPSKQVIEISREFDLPVNLLFKAYTEPELVEQWMGTKVLKMDSKKHGSYQFETTADGHVVFQASGAIHELIPDLKIIRTFEMGNAPFGVQLEIYEFEKLSDDTSRLNMRTIYETGDLRDQVLKMPFAQGLGMAHDRIQQVVGKLK